MSQQTTERREHRPATPRYEMLLAERVRTGRLYVDGLCHQADAAEVRALFDRVQVLDRALSRFRRYLLDEQRVVMPAEDDRWHVPGAPPATSPECHLCLKSLLGLPLHLVLPPLPGGLAPKTGRAA